MPRDVHADQAGHAVDGDWGEPEREKGSEIERAKERGRKRERQGLIKEVKT